MNLSWVNSRWIILFSFIGHLHYLKSKYTLMKKSGRTNIV